MKALRWVSSLSFRRTRSLPRRYHYDQSSGKQGHHYKSHIGRNSLCGVFAHWESSVTPPGQLALMVSDAEADSYSFWLSAMASRC